MPPAQRVRKDSIPSQEIPIDESPFVGEPVPDLESVRPLMPKSKAETDLILKALLSTYVMTGSMLSAVPSWEADGIHIVRNAEELTESWRQLLDSDTKLRKTMLKVVQGSGWGAVISAHVMVAIPIFKNHRDSFSHLVRKKDDVEASNERNAA